MKTLVSAVSVLILAGCGSGMAPGSKHSRSASAVSDTTRQHIIDACSLPFTGIGGTGGELSSTTCGVPVPTSGADEDAQHWWFFAGCLVDHPDRFSNDCRAQFDATCGHNGDLCICDVGEVLQDDGSCAPSGCLTITQACDDRGLNCGSVSDNCGGSYDCGTCGPGVTCGGGGTPNVCGACTPLTPAQACTNHGFNCGAVSDGCGGTINCGTCTLPETCGGGGTAHVCGPGLCVPQTCAAQGFQCGIASDTCGGDLNCGACPPGKACVANACIVPPPQPSGDVMRQGVIDACTPPLSSATCGVPVPSVGTDQDPQHWWFFAGCLADHPSLFSAACINGFDATCGHNGDKCICDPGEVLQDDGTCL